MRAEAKQKFEIGAYVETIEAVYGNGVHGVVVSYDILKDRYLIKYTHTGGSLWYCPDRLKRVKDTPEIMTNSGYNAVHKVCNPVGVLTEEQKNIVKSAIDSMNKQDKLEVNKYNTVTKPKHYMLFEDKNIEVRDLMSLLSTRLQTAGYSAMFISDYIQAMQYVLRFDQKNGKEDISKAIWYFNKMLESYPEDKEV